MEISARQDLYHDHQLGTCITQHERTINGKRFLFTYVADKHGCTITTTSYDLYSPIKHRLTFTNG